MISPRRAPVKPRVVSCNTDEILLLEDVIGCCVEKGTCGAVELVGGPRTGKTTALAHLASLTIADKLTLLDDASPGDVLLGGPHCFVVYTTRRSHDRGNLCYRLAPWSDDDLIEYLLATHPNCCSSVLSRFTSDSNKISLQGNAELYCMIAEQLAVGESVDEIRTAVRQGIEQRVADERTYQDAQFYAAAGLLGEQHLAEARAGEMLQRGVNKNLFGLLGHPCVQVLLSADWVMAVLRRENSENPFPTKQFSRELVTETARLAERDPAAVARLRELVEGGEEDYVPMAASVLHLADPNWRPDRSRCCYLPGAHLFNVQWREIDLGQVNLDGADLRSSDLKGANLERSRLVKSTLRGSKLAGAQLVEATAHLADFSLADLTRADMTRGQFVRADFSCSSLNHVAAADANFHGADLSGTSLRAANLTGCDFRGASFSDTDLQDADMRGANLSRRNLRKAALQGANLADCILAHCDLEFMELLNARFEGADLTDAWLTGSVMTGADFRKAKLRDAGLADVEWEQVDLRGADLRGCSFHMGSSRSGLVGSPYPGHGSRTGFYTNDYDEQSYKAPEEIRKANLRGADLRGALVDGVDFYLVDLRDAKYDPGQGEHFRRCDAILVGRTT